MLENLIFPVGVKEAENHLEFPGRLCRTFFVAVWPAEVSLGWLNDLYRQPDADVSVYLFPLDKYHAMSRLTEMVTRAKAHYELQARRGSESELPELEAVWACAEALRRSVQQGYEKIFKAVVLVTVHAPDRETLDKRCADIETVLASESARVVPCYLNQKEGFSCSLPFGLLPQTQSEVKARDVTLGGAVSVLPVIDDSFTHPSGAFIGRTASGSPVFLDPFIGPPDLPNPHIAVFGYTGSGKSVTLKVLTARLSLLGVRALVIDWEGEYERILNLCGGEVVRIDPSRPSGINPFEIEAETDGGRAFVNLADKVSDIRGLIATVVRHFAGRPLAAREMSAVEETVREDYRRRGITEDPDSLYHIPPPEGGRFYTGRVKKPLPTLTSFYEILKNKPGAEDLLIELKPFLRGNTLGIFDGESEINPDAPVTVIDISRIRDEFTRFYAVYVILNWAWHRFSAQTGKKLIVNDEAWMFMRHPESAEFLETLARRGRKRQTGLVIASQHIEEFLKSEQGKAVISSCATRLILAQSSTAIPDVVKAFSLPPSAANLIGSFREGEGILQVRDAVSRVRVEVMQFELPHVETSHRG